MGDSGIGFEINSRTSGVLLHRTRCMTDKGDELRLGFTADDDTRGIDSSATSTNTLFSRSNVVAM